MKLKVAQLIHRAFCIGILIFAGTVLFINQGKLYFSLAHTDTDLITAPIMVIVVLAIAPIISNKVLAPAEEATDIPSKLARYQTAFIVKAALYESAALFNIVCCLITSNALFMVFAMLTFFALWWSKPTLAKAALTLGVQESDLANEI